jgi:hypothetical protein
MGKMLQAAARLFIIAALSGAGVGCQQAHAAELASRVRFLYTASLSTTAEQPEGEAECGREQTTFESSGYLSIDREEPSVRLEGFGCSIGVEGRRRPCFRRTLSRACLLASSASRDWASSSSISRPSLST